MMQIQGMNGTPIQPMAEPAESVKETREELSENNLELSDKSLDDRAVTSLSAMFELV